MMGMLDLVGSLDLSDIRLPVLMIYSPDDQVVSAKKIENMFAGIGSDRKKLIPYTASKNPSQHVLAGDILSPDSTQDFAKMIVEFVSSEE